MLSLQDMANEIHISPIKELNTSPTEAISRAVFKAASDSSPVTPVSTTLSDDAGEIKYTHFVQSDAFCGPSSLRILLSHFDKNYSEEDLAKLSGATKDNGTEHEGLIKAIKALGGYAFAKENGSMDEIKYFIKQEKLPVLVGWFDKDGDHYSVVANVTDKHIILVDPAFGEGKRQIDINEFPKIWFDFVGADNRAVSWGWYMVVNFEPKQFKILGNYY